MRAQVTQHQQNIPYLLTKDRKKHLQLPWLQNFACRHERRREI